MYVQQLRHCFGTICRVFHQRYATPGAPCDFLYLMSFRHVCMLIDALQSCVCYVQFTNPHPQAYNSVQGVPSCSSKMLAAVLAGWGCANFDIMGVDPLLRIVKLYAPEHHTTRAVIYALLASAHAYLGC